MKFYIVRTSSEPIGLDGLIREKIHKIKRCGKDFYDRNPNNWLNKECSDITLVDNDGCSYYEGVDKNGIYVYLYEMNSLEEMKLLVERVGPVIMFTPECAEGYPTLEIYDDYRE